MYFNKSQVYVLINFCEVEEMFPAAAQEKGDEVFDNGKFALGYKCECFPGCTHAFAERGDIKDPLIKVRKDLGWFKTPAEFFQEHL
ncbi:hypothetical protein BDR07DRAFT_605434 [Suillus spraguei]|nr:hypothetical protein BDR07DRAFT_605434 [Suillus spraguei]